MHEVFSFSVHLFILAARTEEFSDVGIEWDVTGNWEVNEIEDANVDDIVACNNLLQRFRIVLRRVDIFGYLEGLMLISEMFKNKK